MTDAEPAGTGPDVTDAEPEITDRTATASGPPRGTEPGQRRTVPAGAFIIATMVAVAMAVLAIVAVTMDDAGDGGDRELRLAAGRFAERFLTFEHDSLDEWKDDVLGLSTGGFAEEVQDVESGLRALIAESELDAVTQVTDIFVGEPERGTVRVVIVYDRDLRGEGVDRTETDRYLQLSLIRVDGAWLVDSVLDVATAGDSGAPVGVDPSGGTPPPRPSTTAPPPAGDG